MSIRAIRIVLTLDVYVEADDAADAYAVSDEIIEQMGGPSRFSRVDVSVGRRVRAEDVDGDEDAPVWGQRGSTVGEALGVTK